jgi:hypothetical protein
VVVVEEEEGERKLIRWDWGICLLRDGKDKFGLVWKREMEE